jgi:hypothetical protein
LTAPEDIHDMTINPTMKSTIDHLRKIQSWSQIDKKTSQENSLVGIFVKNGEGIGSTHRPVHLG